MKITFTCLIRMQEILWETCHNQGTAVLLIFESTVSLVEYLSNFYANLEYNLSPVSIRIETVDTLGINRESLSAAINSNTGDSRRTHFPLLFYPNVLIIAPNYRVRQFLIKHALFPKQIKLIMF